MRTACFRLLEFLVLVRLRRPEGGLEVPPGVGSHFAGVAPNT
jgi:hypothetical protein